MLSNLRITTFLNRVARETAIGPELLRVTGLPNGQQQISFATSQPFDEVQITRSSALSTLDNLNIYYGFELEPRVFQDQTPVLSNFSTGTGQFQVSTNDAVCVVCNTNNTNVLNPERAANANPSSNDYAEVRTGLASALTSERNNSHCVVERAVQGKDNFIALGRVEGFGIGGARSYTFRDDKAATTQASMLYYRLRQVDLDGTETYSPAIMVPLAATKLSALEVYPNPASNSTDVQVDLTRLGLDERSAGLLKIYDLRGTLLRQLPATQLVVNLPGEALPAGSTTQYCSVAKGSS